MLTARIVPCLDCHNGEVVKGIQFQQLRTIGSPVTLAMSYEAQGADEIVVLDISATNEGRSTQLQTVNQIRRESSIPLTVGGGIRSLGHCEALLNAGADKISINSAAVNDPGLINHVANTFGSQCTVLAIDAKRIDSPDNPLQWTVTTHGGKKLTEKSAVSWAREAVDRGAGEILLTSMDRDGTRGGYDLELIAAITSAVNVPVIASGGASTLNHLIEAYNAGANALLIASMVHDNNYTIPEIKQQLIASSIPIRL